LPTFFRREVGWLFEQRVELGLDRLLVRRGVVRAVLKSEESAVIAALPVWDVFGDVLAALVMAAWIPVLAVAATGHVLAAVGTRVRSLHLDTIKIDLIAALETEMVSFFDFWNVHVVRLLSRFFRASSSSGFA
jgi:hypothetical protein